MYLEEAYREVKNEPDARRAMQRGQLPNYCEDCAGGKWRQQMEEQGKCLPQPISQQTELPIEEPQVAMESIGSIHSPWPPR